MGITQLFNIQRKHSQYRQLDWLLLQQIQRKN